MFIICLLSGAILFVPTQQPSKLNLETFQVITMIHKKIINRNYYKNVEAEIRNNLGRLDRVEQSIVREFYRVGSTVNLPMDNPQVAGLQDKLIIRLAQSNLGGSYLVSVGFEMPFMLIGYARSIIDSNIHLIGLPKLNNRTIAEEQKDMLAQSRPPWTRSRYY